MQQILIVVVGPTAVGKTALCVQLAHHFGTEVVSADSRQFFKEMLIGTAKPTPEEMEGIPHHFVGSLSITQDYSVGQYEKEALSCLQQIFTRQPIALLTGGSGLYIKAVCEGMDEMPETNPEIRAELNLRLSQEGLPALTEQLRLLDPDYYQTVDKNNPQRIVRALEVCLSSGQPFSLFRQQNKVERPFRTIKIGLTRTREELYDRINQRMDLMLEAGLLAEAQALAPYQHANALQTVGYSEIYDYLAGKQDWDETVRLLKRNSRRYAKRQLTWFNRDPEIKWFHPAAFADIVGYIETQIQGYI